MNKQILVQVTQADIDKGCPHDTLNCPIAIALMRAIADCFRVSVNGYNCIWELKNGSKYRAEIPPSGVEFIIRFDSCREGQPFSFVLEPREGQPSGSVLEPVISLKRAHKGILIDSNGMVKELTHYQEESLRSLLGPVLPLEKLSVVRFIPPISTSRPGTEKAGGKRAGKFVWKRQRILAERDGHVIIHPVLPT